MMLDAALSYAEQGFKVFPLHTPVLGGCSCRKASCDSIGKHPRTMNGVLDATSEKSKIDYWWRMWSDANIGLATGADSGFIVIDVDPRHGGTETLTQLQEKHGKFTEKVWAKTGGGGWHLFFKHPGFKVKNNQSGKLGSGVDVRGDGGYIVAPPSVHASGESYTWGVDTLDFPQMPDWLLQLLQQSAPAQTFSSDDSDIPDGARNQTLTSLAGAMRRKGMSEESIYAALTIENENRCKPPLPQADVRKIAHSIAGYAPDDPITAFPRRIVADGERPDGVYFVRDLSDKIRELYRKGMRGGMSTGIPSLDWHYTVKLGQWTVVTGIPSHGKTAVLDTILHNLADLHNWKIAITSIENQPLARHAAQLMAIHMGKPFGEGDIPRMTDGEMESAMVWLDEHFVFILPNEGSCTVGGILDCVNWADENGFQTQGVVIDPWNELEHKRPSGMNETEYVSQSLSQMRRFARTGEQKHLWLVAHPTKQQKDPKTQTYGVPTLYDISGSAHFRNKCDMGISVWRDVQNESSPTEIYVQKVRFRECGKVGKVDLYFNVVTGRFDERPPSYSTYTQAEETDMLSRM
jgi:hypothetical protein